MIVLPWPCATEMEFHALASAVLPVAAFTVGAACRLCRVLRSVFTLDTAVWTLWMPPTWRFSTSPVRVLRSLPTVAS
jgi:hypothetical protein